jgi:hypothetical protein
MHNRSVEIFMDGTTAIFALPSFTIMNLCLT